MTRLDTREYQKELYSVFIFQTSYIHYYHFTAVPADLSRTHILYGVLCGQKAMQNSNVLEVMIFDCHKPFFSPFRVTKQSP